VSAHKALRISTYRKRSTHELSLRDPTAKSKRGTSSCGPLLLNDRQTGHHPKNGLLPDRRRSAQNRPDVVRVSNEHAWPLGLKGGWRIGDLHQRFIDNTFSRRDQAQGESSLLDLFQAELAIVLPDNPIALAGGVLKFLAVHDLHCATGVLDDLLPLQNTGCQAHGRSICP
jgi:hypothetical protein